MLRRWQISSDFLPVLAIAGLLSHLVWFLIVGILFIISKPSDCSESSTPGKLLESVLDGTLVIMAISCILETPIIVFGLRGEPPPFTPASTVSDAVQTPRMLAVNARPCETRCVYIAHDFNLAALRRDAVRGVQAA